MYLKNHLTHPHTSKHIQIKCFQTSTNEIALKHTHHPIFVRSNYFDSVSVVFVEKKSKFYANPYIFSTFKCK